MLGVSLRWTSIPYRGSRKSPSRFMLRKLELNAGLMDHKARTQTLPYNRDTTCYTHIPLFKFALNDSHLLNCSGLVLVDETQKLLRMRLAELSSPKFYLLFGKCQRKKRKT